MDAGDAVFREVDYYAAGVVAARDHESVNIVLAESHHDTVILVGVVDLRDFYSAVACVAACKLRCDVVGALFIKFDEVVKVHEVVESCVTVGNGESPHSAHESRTCCSANDCIEAAAVSAGCDDADVLHFAVQSRFTPL